MDKQTIDGSPNVTPLTQRHRDVMLALVLEWAKIDGSMGFFLATIHGFDPAEAAVLIEGMKVSQLFADARKAVRLYPGGEDFARTLKKMKLTYESYSPIRNRITHAYCVGADADQEDRLIFARYSPEGAGLAIENVPLSEMITAHSYAKQLNETIWKLIPEFEKFQKK